MSKKKGITAIDATGSREGVIRNCTFGPGIETAVHAPGSHNLRLEGNRHYRDAPSPSVEGPKQERPRGRSMALIPELPWKRKSAKEPTGIPDADSDARRADSAS